MQKLRVLSSATPGDPRLTENPTQLSVRRWREVSAVFTQDQVIFADDYLPESKEISRAFYSGIGSRGILHFSSKPPLLFLPSEDLGLGLLPSWYPQPFTTLRVIKMVSPRFLPSLFPLNSKLVAVLRCAL